MRQHPLIPVIRFWLLIAFLVVLAFMSPACGMFAIGLAAANSCGSCSCCIIFTDDFATDRTGTDYTTVSGSFSVGSGKLTCTSASSLIVASTVTDSGATAAWVQADLTPATTSDIARLIIGYVDASNYWFIELQQGATNGTLKLFQRSGGSNTQKGSTVTVSGYTSGTKTVCLCYAHDEITVTVTGGAELAFAATITIASTKAGLGTGSGSSSVSFDNFSLNKHHKDNSTCQPCCGGGTCTYCDTGTRPNYVQVVWTGVSNAFCTDCATLCNNTFVLPLMLDNCVFIGDDTGVCASGGGIVSGYHPSVSMAPYFPNGFQPTIPYSFSAGFSVAGGYDCALYSTLTTPRDCSTDESPTSGGGAGTYCSTASAAVTASAI